MSSSSSLRPTFLISIVGTPGVGKSAFVNRHATGEFTTEYRQTIATSMVNLPFHTSAGRVDLCTLEADSTARPDGVIIIFDLTSPPSFLAVPGLCRSVRTRDPTAPIVVCGNKCDRPDRAVKAKDIAISRLLDAPYWDISVKSNQNFEKPFLSLIRKLMGDKDIRFVEAPSLLPSGLVATEAQLRQWARSALPGPAGADIPTDDRPPTPKRETDEEMLGIIDQIDSFPAQLKSRGFVSAGSAHEMRHDMTTGRFGFTTPGGVKYTLTMTLSKD